MGEDRTDAVFILIMMNMVVFKLIRMNMVDKLSTDATPPPS